MTVYAIAQGRVKNPEAFNKYVELAVPTLKAHHVNILAADDSPAMIEGQVEYARTVILEFSDSDAFYAWYNSPEYQAARRHRLDASAGTFILVNGT